MASHSDLSEGDARFTNKDNPLTAGDKAFADELQASTQMDMKGSIDVCRKAIEKMSPTQRKLFFPGPIAPETKLRTAKLQNLLLQTAMRGPIRTHLEVKAAKRAQNASAGTGVSGGRETGRKIRSESGDENVYVEPVAEEKWPNLDPFAPAVCDLFEMARDDNAFMKLCALFDSEAEVNYGQIAGTYLENSKATELDVTPLMYEVLAFSHWKSFKIQDPTVHVEGEQIEREQRLRCFAEYFTGLRETYGLAPYSQLRYRYSNAFQRAPVHSSL